MQIIYPGGAVLFFIIVIGVFSHLLLCFKFFVFIFLKYLISVSLVKIIVVNHYF